MNTSADDFKIKALLRDKDALLLIGLSLLLAVLLVLGLALMSEEQWNRLVQRSNILWAAALAALPTLLAIWQRYQLRRDAVRGLGQASSPLVHAEQTVTTPAGSDRPAMQTNMGPQPLLPREGGQIGPYDALGLLLLVVIIVLLVRAL